VTGDRGDGRIWSNGGHGTAGTSGRDERRPVDHRAAGRGPLFVLGLAIVFPSTDDIDLRALALWSAIALRT